MNIGDKVHIPGNTVWDGLMEITNVQPGWVHAKHPSKGIGAFKSSEVIPYVEGTIKVGDIVWHKQAFTPWKGPMNVYGENGMPGYWNVLHPELGVGGFTASELSHDPISQGSTWGPNIAPLLKKEPQYAHELMKIK